MVLLSDSTPIRSIITFCEDHHRSSYLVVHQHGGCFPFSFVILKVMTSHENALYDLHYDSYNWPIGQTIETILLILSRFKQLDVSASASVRLYCVSCTLSVNYVHLGFTLALIRRKGNNITPYYTTQIHLVTHTWYNPVEVPILNFLHLKDQNTKTIKTCCI